MDYSLNIKGRIFDISKPAVMGILNISPDSFYDGGKYNSIEKIKSRISVMLDDGADIIDIGAMSSRPGAKIIDTETEWQRLKPCLELILKDYSDIIFSIDTIRAEIADRVISDYGACIINDISAGELDKNMFNVIAKHKTPYIIMHTRGTPENMTKKTNYEKNIIDEIIYYFSEKISKLSSMGLSDIIIDPGFGFAKNINQNYYILNNLDKLRIFDKPILVGLSRKSMIWKTLETTPDSNSTLLATQSLNTVALQKTANILRVHDVKPAKELVRIHSKLITE